MQVIRNKICPRLNGHHGQLAVVLILVVTTCFLYYFDLGYDIELEKKSISSYFFRDKQQQESTIDSPLDSLDNDLNEEVELFEIEIESQVQPAPTPTPVAEQIPEPDQINTLDLFVFNNSQIDQNDPRLLDAVFQLLVPPSEKPYNFANPEVASDSLSVNYSGVQVQAVQDILQGFGNKGFFVEYTALDGEWSSNTIWLENTLGWDGLLLEPDPNSYELLMSKQRNAVIANLCISGARFPFISKIQLGDGVTAEIKCVPLYSLLMASGVNLIVDFLSFNTHDSVIDILSTVPLNSVVIKVIGIRHVGNNNSIPEIKQFLEDRYYIFLKTVNNTMPFLEGTSDSVFIHNSVKVEKEQSSGIQNEYLDADFVEEPF